MKLLTYEGFYDKENEWITLQNVQIVASMNASNTLGRHQLTSRSENLQNVTI